MKKTMKSAIALLLCVCMAFSLVACGGAASSAAPAAPAQSGSAAPAAPAEETFTLRLASDVAEDHPKAKALMDFEKYVEETSGGTLQIELFHNAALGDANAYTESVVNGAVEMASMGSELAQRAPVTAAFEAPFAFADWKAIENAVYSDYGANLLSDLPDTVGIRFLGYIPQGFRVIMSNKPLNSMEDLSGMRLRVPQIALYLAIGEGLGTNPIGMALSELYTAIEQDAVDGLENTYSYLASAKYYEVTQYLLESNHNFVMHAVYINEKVWDKLSENQQQILLDGGALCQEKAFEYFQAFEKTAKEEITNGGVTIITPDEAFRQQLVDSQVEAMKVFYETYAGTEQIVAELMKAAEG